MIIFCHDTTAPSGPGLPHYRGFTITLRRPTLGRTPLTSDQLVAKISTCKNTTITRGRHHVSVGIPTHNSSKREVADLRVRPRGPWIQPVYANTNAQPSCGRVLFKKLTVAQLVKKLPVLDDFSEPVELISPLDTVLFKFSFNIKG